LPFMVFCSNYIIIGKEQKRKILSRISALFLSGLLIQPLFISSNNRMHREHSSRALPQFLIFNF
ncbi:MAG: hypothetical protein R3Y32_05100, partial [Bacillota bacterium]